jgi:hypothetical protein
MSTLREPIKFGTEGHRKILRELETRIKYSETKLESQREKWARAEDKMLAYLPAREADDARKIDREGGLPTYTTIQIPYSYAVAMTAHTYLTSVFLGRSPIFQYQGMHGETQQQEQCAETLISYQTLSGGITPQLYSWLYDACKYGVAILGTYWDEEIHRVTLLDDVVDPESGAVSQQSTTLDIPGYTGNRCYPIAPRNFLWDPRVSFRNFQAGEYCGVRQRVGWNTIVQRRAKGTYTNTEFIDKKIPEEFQNNFDNSSLVTPTSAVGQDAPHIAYTPMGADEKQHPTIVPVYEMYVTIIPKDWGISEGDLPEKWVFSVTGDFKVILGCEPLGLMHNKYPMNILELEPDALALTNRGIPEILDGVQQTVDWLVNSHFYNTRAALNNQWVVDPSRVVMKDVTDPLPGGVIRIKPSAYGMDVRTMLSQMPVTDVTRQHMTDLPNILAIGERVLGVNDQMMGMIAGGGRKTATEVRTSSTFGVGRLKTNAEYMSALGFSPLASMLIQNSQQLFDGEKKFRIVGDLTLDAPQFLNINAEAIAGNYEFMPIDGTLPIDRMAQVGIWTNLFAQIRQFPAITMAYDMGRIFSWVAKLAGIRNIDQFKLGPMQQMQQAIQAQVVPDEQLQREAQRGNSIPMAPEASPAGLPSPAFGG